jgi:hypothetical protein
MGPCAMAADSMAIRPGLRGAIWPARPESGQAEASGFGAEAVAVVRMGDPDER